MRPKIRWGTLPASLAVGLLVFMMAATVIVPQVIAVAFTAPARLYGENRLTLLDVFPLWVMSDPTERTGAAVSGVVHHAIVWSVVLLAAISVLTAGFVVMNRREDPQRRDGLATVEEVEKELTSEQLIKKRGSQLRPRIPARKLRPEDCGYRMGYFRKRDVWLRAEDPTVVIGPSRSGKGWYLILNWILSAPGAVVTTSSKMDNVAMTMTERIRRHGNDHVWVFAPGIAGGEDMGNVLRWDPVKGCVEEETLVRRIHALIPSDAFSGSTSNGGHWDTLGQQLAAALFHAAACLDVTVEQIQDWVVSPQRAREAIQGIREHPNGLLEYASYLEQVLNMPAEQRATNWGVLPTSLAFLQSGIARKWMTPTEGEEIDLVQFLLKKGTLYLVGDEQSTGGYKRIIDGLLAEIDYVSKSLADAFPGGRLDPPLTYLLDEAGNFEYQGLYELITAGGGRGRVGVAVFQAQSQLAQWGQDKAGTIWNAATAKIVLGGSTDEKELAAMSQIIGERWVAREQHTWGVGPGSVSVSEEKRAVIESYEIRELPDGYALLFYRKLKPVIPKMIPFSENRAFEQCVADSKEMARRVAARSPFALAVQEYLKGENLAPADVREMLERSESGE